MTVKAYDFQADYSLNLGDIGLDNWGQMRFNLRATNLDSFVYQERVTAPAKEAVGRQNFATGAAPAAPDWKANFTIGWTNGNHNITAITRYVDEMIYDGSDFSFIQRYANTTYRKVDTINRWVDADINYSYRGLDLFGGSANITVGMRNAFDRQPQKVSLFGGVVGELQDALARIVYARVSYDF